jgi:hypothetical protein
MDELHIERMRQVGQPSRQHRAAPGMADFSDLEVVLSGEGVNEGQVFVGSSVLMGKLLAREVMPFMRKLPGHALQVFMHGLVRSSRPQYQDYSSLVLRIDRRTSHHFTVREMINLSYRNILMRCHRTTYGFRNLQSL